MQIIIVAYLEAEHYAFENVLFLHPLENKPQFEYILFLELFSSDLTKIVVTFFQKSLNSVVVYLGPLYKFHI